MDQILNWLTENQGMLLGYALKVLIALAIFVIGRIVANNISKVMAKAMQAKGMDNAVISFLTAIVKVAIIIAALLMALSQLGVQTNSFIAILFICSF